MPENSGPASEGQRQRPTKRVTNRGKEYLQKEYLPVKQFEAICVKNISYQVRFGENKKKFDQTMDTKRKLKDPFLFSPINNLNSIVKMDEKQIQTSQFVKAMDLRDLVSKASQSLADKNQDPSLKSEVIKVVRKIQAEFERKQDLQLASGSGISMGRREITGAFDFCPGYFEFHKANPIPTDHHLRKSTAKAEPNHLKTLPFKDNSRSLGHRSGGAVSKDALAPVTVNPISIFDKRLVLASNPVKRESFRPKETPLLPKSPPLPAQNTSSIVPAISLPKKPPIPRIRPLPKSVLRSTKNDSQIQEIKFAGSKLVDEPLGPRKSKELTKQSIVETPQIPSLPPNRLKYLEYFKDKELGSKLLESFPKVSSKSFVSRCLTAGGLRDGFRKAYFRVQDALQTRNSLANQTSDSVRIAGDLEPGRNRL